MPRPQPLPELRFVVVGADAVGKSTFMHHALDLKRTPVPPAASKKMSLEGAVYLISLMETRLACVDVDDDLSISWPPGPAASSVDGVLALYDVSRRSTLKGIPDLLNACSKGRIPCVLVATKCDLPSDRREVDPREVERSCMRETGIEACQTHEQLTDTHKRCISIVLRNVLANNPVSSHGTRSRATTTSLASPSAPAVPVASTPPAGHARATSASAAMDPVRLPVSSPVLDEIPQSPPLELHGDDLWSAVEASQLPRPQPFAADPRRRRPDTPTTIADSLIDGNRGNSDNEDESAAPAQPAQAAAPPSNDGGRTLEELVARLVSMPMSKEDVKYNAAFLCLYRKFAAPAQLLGVLIGHFEGLHDDDEPHLLVLDAQLRVVAMLARWVAEYPGDFAHHATRHYLNCFLEHLAKNSIFAAAVGEISAVLELRAVDDDVTWAISDSQRGDAATMQSFPRLPYLTEVFYPAPENKDDEEAASGGDVLSFADSGEADSLGQTKVSSSGFSGDRSGASGSTSSFSLLLDSVSEAQRVAELLGPLSRVPLGKTQWHQLMEYTDDDIAREMTRIDWIMYSAIRPRDLIRHVSLTEIKRENCRSLDHVNRMIGHFNHVAFWTSSMILLRDKPKHRARALEKFMTIAWKLRQLNNYNSLGAIMAGIHGTPVHRLSHTRELVAPAFQREFMRLEILMGTQRSHFHYRMAWDNSPGEKIPFLPLHRRDLVSTEEGNSTFTGSNGIRINWRKFQIMGDTVVGIQESQSMPYPDIPKNVDIQRLILDAKFAKDEDALYERSLQVEAPANNESRRRLNWLSRSGT